MIPANQLGKPSGVSLADHTQHVMEHGRAILKQWPFLSQKYAELTNGDDLAALLEVAIEYHDYGKMHPQWQQACQKDYERYIAWCEKQGDSVDVLDWRVRDKYETECYHNKVSASPALFKAGFRHEFDSVAQIEKFAPTAELPIRVAIAAHHGKLSARENHMNRWRNDGKSRPEIPEEGPYYDYYRRFKQDSERAVKNGRRSNKSLEEVILNRYRHDAIRSLLQMADTRASREEGMGSAGTVHLTSFAEPKSIVGSTGLRPVQEVARRYANSWRTILRAPTGGGKTYAALLWAQEQILSDRPRADRMVIAMPTRFTSNALRNSVMEQMDHVGLYHSSAFFNLYGDEGPDFNRSKAMEKQKLARLLANPVTVCTIDHLLTCLTGAKEDHHTVFFLLANSCVVFDETDFYDPFVQANLVKLLEVLAILKVPTLIMSATVPDSARELYNVADPIRAVDQPGSERVHKMLKHLGAAEEPADAKEALEEMLQEREGIIYANTVKRALAYYVYLKNEVAERNLSIPLAIYHSRFTEPDKKRKEEQIERLLGKVKGGKVPTGGIVILTQIGEMSINISSKLMLTDVAPWDRLAQRVGRLARFIPEGHEEVFAKIYTVEPTRNGEAFPAPYGTIKRGSPWIPYPAYTKTLADIQRFTIDLQRLTPDYLVQRTNAIYPNVEATKDDALENVRNYQKCMRDNWMIVPSYRISDDETEVGDPLNAWKARDIPGQAIVLTECLYKFSNFGKFNEFVLRHGVACPQYQIDQQSRKAEGSAITVNEIIIGQPPRQEKVKVNFAVPGSYSSELGFAALYDLSWTPEIIF